MIIAIWIAVAILIVAVVLLLGAQVELLEQLKQLRRVFGLEDGSKPIALPEWSGRMAHEAGFPRQLVSEQAALVLFVSNTCATCHTLAEGMRGGRLPDNLWLVIVNVRDTGEDFQSRYALYGDRIVTEGGQEIMKNLGISLTPIAVILTRGEIQRAQTIPSLHQLDIALEVLDNEKLKGVNA